MKKKIMSLICAISFVISTSSVNIIGINADTVDDNQVKIIDEFKNVSVNIEEDFSPDEVLVYFKHQNRVLNKIWKAEDFNINGIKEIEDLTYIDKSQKECEEYLDRVTFRQIIKLTLDKKNKQNVCDAIEKLSCMSDVYMVTPNYYEYVEESEISDFERFSYRTSNYAFNKMQVQNAWQYTTGSSSVEVGIMDTGIDNNQYLSGNLGVGYNVADNNYDTSDSDGHGTAVAGVIGGSTTGICNKVTLIPIKIVSSETNSTSAAIKINAINYANNNEIPILNMSYAGISLSSYSGVDVAISNYDGLFVNSAGNMHTNIDNPSESGVSFTFYPALFDCPNMIVVTETDENDELNISAYGPVSVDLAAPAHYVPSVGIGGTIIETLGTSIASPYVAGTAALLLSYNHNLTTSQLKSAILNSVDHVNKLQGKVLTNGRLNVYKAVKYVEPQGKYRNYVVRNEVGAAYNSNNSAYLSLENMRELYRVVDGRLGDASASNVNISKYIQTTGWYDKNIIMLNSVNALSSGSVANFIIRSNFLGDRNFIESEMQYYSNNNAIHSNFILLGDINLDGNVDSSDLSILSQVVVGNTTITGDSYLSADVNQDNLVNMQDLSTLNSYVNNAISKFF